MADYNIALGVKQPEPVNYLGQMAQVMGIKALQNEVQGEEDVRAAIQGGMSPTDPRMLQFGKHGAVAVKAGSELANRESEIKARDIKTVQDTLKAYKDQLSMVKTSEDAERWTTGAYGTPLVGKVLSQIMPMDRFLAGIPRSGNPADLEAWKRNASLGADKLYQSADNIATNAARIQAANIAASASRANNADTIRAQREALHPVETGSGPGFYSTAGGGVIRPGFIDQGFNPNAPVPAPAAANFLTVSPGAAPAPATTPANGLLTSSAAPQKGASTVANANAAAAGQPRFVPATPKLPMTVSVNTQLPASEEAQRDFIKSSRATYDQLKQAPAVLANIEAAKALVPQAKGFMGTGGETMLSIAKFMNNRLGTSIDTQGIKSAEELNSRLFMGIMDNLKKMDSQPSLPQQNALKEALGNLGTDPNAMNNVLDVFGDIVREKVGLHNQEVTSAEERGVKFPYKPQIELTPKKGAPAKTVTRTGTLNGRKIVQYSDGSAEYAD